MSLEKMFHLKENNTTVKTEIMAGVTSFMTMAYILAVNPNILAAAEWTTERSSQRQRWHPLSEHSVWHCSRTTRLLWHLEWV